MLSLKSEPTEDTTLLDLPSPPPELDYWERLIFSFDMDREAPNSPRDGRVPDRHMSRSRSTSSPSSTQVPGSSQPNPQEAALLAQFAGSPSHSYDALLQALRAGQSEAYPSYPHQSIIPPGFLNPQSHSSGQPFPLPPPTNIPWDQLPPQFLPPSMYGIQPHDSRLNTEVVPSLFSQPSYLQFPPTNVGHPALLTNPNPQPVASTSSAQHAQPPAQPPTITDADTEREAISEDKRRRNTAASARFRVKKKMRTLDLERSVSDLTDRAEELEREAADLRRENGWLKEIVMLKGSRIAAMSAALEKQQEAASQSRHAESTSSPTQERSGSEDRDHTSGDEGDTREKGKGKAKSK